MTFDTGTLWIPATLIASAGQVARNTMQRRLTESIGTLGATQVRFLYGFPFALVFLAIVPTLTGESLPGGNARFAGFLAFGAMTQIAATALMLAAMRLRSFSVVTALLKTEPVQLAVFGFVVLGDRLSPLGVSAVLVATLGVIVVSWTRKTGGDLTEGGVRPVAFGLASGACFALSAIGFRGAILALDSGSFLIRATTTLTWSLGVQTALLGTWLIVFNRPALVGSLREWRTSLLAGFVGAGSSQFWFIGFALTAAANVRTLALVEVILAQFVSRRVLSQAGSPREFAGIVLIIAGVGALLLSAA